MAAVTAASLGVQRLWPAREKKLTCQIRQISASIEQVRAEVAAQ